jgi:small-conductance mechanosensitive channel
VDKSDVLLAVLLVAVVAFQAWVTVRVHRSSEYDPDQKRAQTKLIWLVPLIGAAVAFSVLEDDDKKDPPDREQRG